MIAPLGSQSRSLSPAATEEGGPSSPERIAEVIEGCREGDEGDEEDHTSLIRAELPEWDQEVVQRWKIVVFLSS